MLKYVIGISWPRSGHHLLVDLLHGYFGPRFKSCEASVRTKNCCHTFPCSRSEVINFSKSHDFGLQAPKLADQQYVIQFRQFVPSIISNFELHVGEGAEDSAEEFRRFVIGWTDTYINFMNKWGDPTDHRFKAIRIPYEALVESPHKTLSELVRLIAPNEEVDDAEIDRSVRHVQGNAYKDRKRTVTENFGVKATRQIESFRYYDEQLLAPIAQMTSNVYEQAISPQSEFDEQQIVRDAFRWILGHEPSQERLALLARKVKELGRIEGSILIRSELLSSLKGSSSEELIRLCYRGILNREPDPKGLIDHTVAMDAGVTLENIMRAMIKSREFSRKFSAAKEASSL